MKKAIVLLQLISFICFIAGTCMATTPMAIFKGIMMSTMMGICLYNTISQR